MFVFSLPLSRRAFISERGKELKQEGRFVVCVYGTYIRGPPMGGGYKGHFVDGWIDRWIVRWIVRWIGWK